MPEEPAPSISGKCAALAAWGLAEGAALAGGGAVEPL